MRKLTGPNLFWYIFDWKQPESRSGFNNKLTTNVSKGYWNCSKFAFSGCLIYTLKPNKRLYCNSATQVQLVTTTWVQVSTRTALLSSTLLHGTSSTHPLAHHLICVSPSIGRLNNVRTMNKAVMLFVQSDDDRPAVTSRSMLFAP